MSAETSNLVLMILGAMFVIGGLLVIFFTPILILFFPKSIKENALCPPHFTESHALTLNYFPYTITRNTIVTCSLAIPYYGKRYKGLDDALHKHSPKWFKVLTYIYIWLGLIPGILGLLGFAIFF